METITVTNKLRIFIRFLKDNNVYNNYIASISSSYSFYGFKVFETHNCVAWLYEAFSWDDSSEGFTFWCKLDKKWSTFLKHNKIS